MQFNRTLPHNTLPPLPPKSVDLESKKILKASIIAHASLGELRGMGAIIPNQNLILRSIALQEAKLSSEIENIVTTNDELYQAFDHHQNKLDPSTKEVLLYQEALWHGVDAIKQRPLHVSLFLEIASILKNEPISLRTRPGTHISDGKGGILYTPPEGAFIIRGKLEQLEKFMEASNGLDPLVKMALAHYQFEAIHPFLDGNGRTGRILNILFLLKKGLLTAPILYLSRYIIENKNAYYEGLRAITENGSWESWVVYILQGVHLTAQKASTQIQRIRGSIDTLSTEMAKKTPKIHSLDLVHLLFQQPYCRIGDLEKAGIAKRETASKYLQALAQAGLLKPIRSGTQILYLNTVLLDILSG